MGVDNLDYKLYFFREKNKSIDVLKIIDFFDSIEGMTTTVDGETVIIEYLNEQTNNHAIFYFTPALLVPNIYKLNPKYISLKFHMEMGIDMPNFNAETIFKIIGMMAKTFDIFMYNTLFENVLPYRAELLTTSYYNIKKYYLDNYHGDKKYYMVDNKIMNDVLRYQTDMFDLQKYYKEDNIIVPRYVFLVDDQDAIHLAAEWSEGSAIILPAHIDIVFYKFDNQLKMIYAREVLDSVNPDDLPGFIQGTKIINQKAAKKARKIMHKTRFTMVTESFESTTLDTLVDL